MTGTSSSLASSLSARENSETSCWRLSTLLAAGHQLEVVDDDELEVVALLEPPALGPDLHHRHVGRVVDEQRRVGDLAHPPGQPGPVVVGELAGAHVVQRHPRLGGEQPHGDLVAAHLQREDAGRHLVLDRRRPRDVQPQRRVVRRDHRRAGQVEVVGVVDLHAPDRHVGGRGRTSTMKRTPTSRSRPDAALLVDQALALEPEDVVVGREGQDVAGRAGLGAGPRRACVDTRTGSRG